MRISDNVRKPGMSRNGIFVAALLAGAGLFSACSDSETVDSVIPAKIDVANITVNNDAAELAKRVKLYKGGTPESRAGEWSMPEQPLVPATALDIEAENLEGTEFKVNATDEISVDIAKKGLSNITLYVKGAVSLSNWAGGTIYILEGGSVKFKGSYSGETEIYNYGTLKLLGESLSLTTLMSVGDLDLTDKDLAVSEKLYVGGNLKVAVLSLNSGEAKLNGCSVSCKELKLDNKAVFGLAAGSFFKALDTTIEGNSRLLAGEQSYLKVGNLTNTPGTDGGIEVKGSKFSVVEAVTYTVEATDQRPYLKGRVGLHYDKLADKAGNKVEPDFLSSVRVNGNDRTYIPAVEGCHEGYGTAPADPDAKEVIIEHIGDLSGGGLSATAVDVAGGKAYVSYHQQGTGYSGQVDVIDFPTAETFSLTSSMSTAYTYDFNHILVNNGQLYLAGGEDKKGAFLAYVPLNGGIFTATELKVVRVPGDDANSVAYSYNNHYMVATTDGFYSLNANDYSRVDEHTTTGSAKFIHVNGTDMVTLNLTERKTDVSDAELTVWDSGDPNFGSQKGAYYIQGITPTDGKNVVRIDGNNLYVCAGVKGLLRYTIAANGKAIEANGSFVLGNTNATVNGMDFDGEYIYLAYGRKGLRILDKNTLEEVANYSHCGGKSANYVKLANGNICVAYGINGLQVFKLAEN